MDMNIICNHITTRDKSITTLIPRGDGIFTRVTKYYDNSGRFGNYKGLQRATYHNYFDKKTVKLLCDFCPRGRQNKSDMVVIYTGDPSHICNDCKTAINNIQSITINNQQFLYDHSAVSCSAGAFAYNDIDCSEYKVIKRYKKHCYFCGTRKKCDNSECSNKLNTLRSAFIRRLSQCYWPALHINIIGDIKQYIIRLLILRIK